jgi:hypothetical protein
MSDERLQEAMEGDRYVHKECGGITVWDLSGGFCVKCHAEGLDTDDVKRADPEVTTGGPS